MSSLVGSSGSADRNASVKYVSAVPVSERSVTRFAFSSGYGTWHPWQDIAAIGPPVSLPAKWICVGSLPPPTSGAVGSLSGFGSPPIVTR